MEALDSLLTITAIAVCILLHAVDDVAGFSWNLVDSRENGETNRARGEA